MGAIPGSDRDADRAGVLVASGAEVVLIERRRDGLHYWVAPGGGVEPGETPDVAAAREALEELGLHVVVERKVLELHGLHPLDRVQHYFLASTEEREFRGMTGPEMAASSNTYTPRWVGLREVANIELLPVQLGGFLADVAESGWPDELTVISEA